MASQENKMEVEQPQKKDETKEEKKEETVQVTLLLELKNQIRQLSKAISQNDTKIVQKISKQVRKFKRQLKPHHLEKVWQAFFPNGNDKINVDFKQMQGYDSNFSEEFDISKKSVQNISKYSEVNLYIEVLLLVMIFYQREIAKSEKEKNIYYNQGSEFSLKLLEESEKNNKRTHDYLHSVIYFYFFRSKELSNKLLEIRDKLFSLYRTACLNFNEYGQATLLNLILRNYLHFNHYELAHHLVSKSTFPEAISNNEFCRYLYYTGRIQAVQQEYQESLQRLNQALRKAPETTGLGFRIEAQKLAVVVELLQGEIPERSIFAQQELQRPLIPYYKLVQCILKGNLLDFTATVAKYAKYFIRDKLYTLITRLHQIVIKTGLRKINLSYSRISFNDIAQKLHLGKGTEVEFIVAKAIRDNVLQAEIDHTNKWIILKEKKELYNTNEPLNAFSKRIDYCLNLYDVSTKSLQYPAQNLKTIQGKKEDDTDEDEIDPDDLLSDFGF
ncbi:hypothetical protein PPERSA_00797 [Pseudocohnilembus persalinus]|uniref:PCI domain-containing protein n=1 Tax=Pseudocohnilembus persalinus TaxID=266149 RepID=A0A0V0QFR8_PSEPJ|nr:hypothetical protein PPERSA_00797 [Pseudocohnilembus persalinus]|eukprot:KRX01049.1 hypothetical protein PPERSA_00797 [Pseudocohnilembus persalinus]